MGEVEKIMKESKTEVPQVQEQITLVGQRAENLYDAKKICCAEAVLLTLNETFDGGLSPEMAVRLGAGFCGGMGGAGCACGSLTGAEMTLGLFLAPNLPEGLSERKFRSVSKELHDRFKERYLEGMVRDYGISGIIFHDSKTCPNNSNNRYGLPERLARKLDIPYVVINGDLNDLRLYSEEQARTQFEALIEQLQETH